MALIDWNSFIFVHFLPAELATFKCLLISSCLDSHVIRLHLYYCNHQLLELLSDNRFEVPYVFANFSHFVYTDLFISNHTSSELLSCCFGGPRIFATFSHLYIQICPPLWPLCLKAPIICIHVCVPHLQY